MAALSPQVYSPLGRGIVEDLFSDGRTHSAYGGPNRQARLPDIVKAGWLARNEDGTFCAVAGQSCLKIVTVLNSTATGTHVEQTTKNLWWPSGLTNDKTPNSVVWCHGSWSEKIITGSRQGELIMWDLTRASSSKYEQILSPSQPRRRAITRLAYSPKSLNLIAAGAADGQVHLWDLRRADAPPVRSFQASGSGFPVRALMLSPTASDAHLAVVGLDNGTLQRWDLRSPNRPLDVVRVAHTAPIMDFDWLAPAGQGVGNGLIASASMDRTVKLWDLASGHISAPATRTLHTSYPIRRVFFRQDHDTELIVVPSTETDPVEIWDMRREWVSKWTLRTTGDGGIHDLVQAKGHLLWAMHQSGAFVQHELRKLDVGRPRPTSFSSGRVNASGSAGKSPSALSRPEPLPSPRTVIYSPSQLTRALPTDATTPPSVLLRTIDTLPLATLSWSPQGMLVFGIHKALQARFAVPYDDVHPDLRPQLAARGFRYKLPTDSAIGQVLPSGETLGESAVPTSGDGVGLAAGEGRTKVEAVRYVMDLSVGRERVCEINAQIAAEAEHWRAAQTWELIRSLLADLHPPETPIPSSPPPARPPSPAHSAALLPQIATTSVRHAPISPIASSPQQRSVSKLRFGSHGGARPIPSSTPRSISVQRTSVSPQLSEVTLAEESLPPSRSSPYATNPTLMETPVLRKVSPAIPVTSSKPVSPALTRHTSYEKRIELMRPPPIPLPTNTASSATIRPVKRGAAVDELEEQRDMVPVLTHTVRERGNSATSSINGSRRDAILQGARPRGESSGIRPSLSRVGSSNSIYRDSLDEPHTPGFVPPTAAMLERRASTISLSVISDSSSSRGSIAPSLRSPGFGGSGGRPSGPARRPSMVGAQPPAPLPPVITSTPSVDHSYSAPIVMTLSGTTGSTASAISSNSTLMNTIPSSPAVSSLLKHAGSSGARAVSTPSFLRRSASGYIGRRSGASTPSSSAAGSPLRNVIELVGEVDEHRPPPVPLPISAGGVSKSISEPQLGSGSLFIGTSISDPVLAVSPRTPLRPGGTRSRRVSLRGTIRTPDTATSAAYESSSSFADAEESNSPSDSERHLFPRFETVDTDELPPRSPLSPIGPPSGRRTGSNSRSRPPNNRRRSRSGTVNRRSVTKQDSTTSIRTVVAMSSPGGRAQPKLFEDEQAAEAEAAEAGDEAAYDSSNFASSSRARDIRVHKERSRELEKLDRTNESGKGKQRRLTNSPETSMLAASDFGSEEGTPRLDTIDPATVLLSVPERDEPGQDLIPEPGSSLGLALGPVAHTDSHSRAPLGRRAGPVTPQLQIQPDNAVPVIISPGGVVDTPKPMEVDDSSGDSLNEYANVALTDSVRAIVRSDEERFRELAWEAVREELEYYAEKGDIQMCAHLATVAPGELSLNSMRQEQFVRAYVELLERNRMHAQAAYVRKYCTIEAVRSRALVHTAVNLACGRCRKPIDIALDSASSMSTKRELRSQALCTNCQLGGARCSICRLPIEGLVIQCPVCTHGGHQDCVRRYYGSQPMRSLHAHEVPARPWHERLGLSGSGISSGPSSVRHATMPPAAARPPAHGMSLLTANAPSRAASLLSTISSAVPSPAMTSSASAAVSSCADGSSGPVGTGAATATATHTVTTTEKNSSVDGGQNGAAARRTPTMMGHPCAAGCGHYCWVASMGQGQSDAAGGFLGLQVAGVAAH